MRSTTALLVPLALAQLLIGLDYNIVYVALPDIAALGFSPATLQWVVSAYALTFGGLLLLAGRLTDALGKRRIFLAGLGLLAAGSLLASLATSEIVMILGRGLQGLGGAALAPSTLALLSTGFPEGSARNRAFGIWGAAGSAGMVLGGILGGVLVELWGWRAVFLVNMPILAFIAVWAVRVLPHDLARAERARIDVPGAILTTLTSLLVVLGFVTAAESGWNALSLSVLAASLVALVVLLLVERRTPAPLFDIRLLARRHLGLGTASTFLFMAGFGSTAYFLTLYFQETRGLSALLTGLAFVVPCGAVLIGTSLGARLSSSRGLRVAMLVGQGVGFLGCVAFALTVGERSSWLIVLSLAALFSLGQGVVFTGMFATATTNVPPAEQGIAGGLATTGQQLGGAIGLAVLVTLTSAIDAPTITMAMWGIAAVIGLGLLVALGIPRSGAGPVAESATTEHCHK